jgi:5'-AMP-activated protein kinase, regulatory gamma subunit
VPGNPFLTTRFFFYCSFYIFSLFFGFRNDINQFYDDDDDDDDNDVDMLVAPLWDPDKCQFVGLLTVTDFIDIMRLSKDTVEALASTSIAVYENRPFLSVDSNCTLKTACQQLLQTQQVYLPVVYAEDMRCLACITFTNILEYMVTHFREQRRLFDDSITDLGIGTYGERVQSVTPDHTLSHALELMQQYDLSAVPVVDALSRKVIGVYTRYDITFLTKATDAKDAVRNFELTVGDILSQTRTDVTTPDALRTCSPNHTLQAIFESFAQVRFNRLFVVDADELLLGVVASKDLVAYFLSDDPTTK